MEIKPSYEESHLLVAAVRVLCHRDGRSPTPGDVAGLIQFSTEKTYVLVHELRKLGVLRVLESAFELRLDVGDPVPLESLPKGATGPSIEGELAEFHSKEQEKKEEMERMFRGGEADRRRKERVARMEQEFMKFKPKRGAAGGSSRTPARARRGQIPSSSPGMVPRVRRADSPRGHRRAATASRRHSPGPRHRFADGPPVLPGSMTPLRTWLTCTPGRRLHGGHKADLHAGRPLAD